MSSCHFGCHVSLKNISLCPLLLPLVPPITPRIPTWRTAASYLSSQAWRLVCSLRYYAQAGAADLHVKFHASSRKLAFSLDTKNASFESLSLPECA